MTQTLLSLLDSNTTCLTYSAAYSEQVPSFNFLISTLFATAIPSNIISLYSSSSLLSTLITSLSCKHFKISAATLGLSLP